VVADRVRSLARRMDVDGKRVVVVVPDGTRTVPLRLLADLVEAELGPRVAELRWLVALGTHQPMSPTELEGRLGPRAGPVANHAWWDPDALVSVGTIPAERMEEITGGRLTTGVDVRVNRAVVEADVALVCGPVFPHEVVGFSGGNKYFFPGVAGPEIIDATHWLGALLTSAALIGAPGPNPVRALIDAAAALIPTVRWCMAVVVAPGGEELVACAVGTPEEAWAEAAAVSSRVHVRRLAAPVTTVLSVMPERYPDIWTAAKGMYKVEPVVADGGEVIILAPHVTTFSVTHDKLLDEVGYHVRDFFLGQWDRYGTYPGSILAHATHLAGAGTWSAGDGERPRIRVTLATGIGPDACAAHGLGYRDPATIDVAGWTAAAASDPSLLVVPEAGEVLYRLEGPLPA
jgi:nickel-dependent lactate racemase